MGELGVHPDRGGSMTSTTTTEERIAAVIGRVILPFFTLAALAWLLLM